jgi:hypothetical protein
MADLGTGRLEPTRDCLRRRLETLAPVADRLGSASLLRYASDLVEENGALRQRRVAEAEGAHGLAEWLASRFLDGPGDRVSGEYRGG